MFTPIPEINARTTPIDLNAIVEAGKPVVFRGLVDDWPMVQAGKISAEAFCNYLRRFDLGQRVNTMSGPPSINGRIFYNSDMSGLNCRKGAEQLSSNLDFLLAHQHDSPMPALAMQSVTVRQNLPGLDQENVMHLLPLKAEPRIWIGSRSTVAAHYDPSENIACCLTGKRKFTLLPPEEVKNLYVGPFELTPAGTTISMVDFDNPDYERFPKFRDAEQAAIETTLEPGDAIFIPYMWWHHVRSLDGVNALMNYWWGGHINSNGDPNNALFYALMTIRNLPEHQRSAWKGMFEHYVFSGQQPVDHIPTERQGLAGELDEEKLYALKQMLIKGLSRSL